MCYNNYIKQTKGEVNIVSDITRLEFFGDADDTIKYKNTSISNSIDIFGAEARYDEQCKRLLSYKEILAWILKECTSEYKEYDIHTIMGCIGKDVSVSKVAVHQFERVVNEDTEDGSVTEGLVKYDIKFTAITPNDEPIQLIINVENQNKYSPGYPLIKRGIYYACRLISAEHGTVFTDEEYGKIVKVYTIWVCTDNFETNVSAITEFSFEKKDIFGTSNRIMKKNYDLATVIIIRLPKDPDNQESALIRMLTYLLSHKFSVEKRKEVLSRDYNIGMQEVYKEVDSMSGLGEAVYQEGIEKGREEGIQALIIDNIEEGFSKEKIILKLQKRFSLTKEQSEKYYQRFSK